MSIGTTRACPASVLRDALPDRVYWELQVLYYRIRAVWYAGNRYLCPCCGGQFRKMMTAGTWPRRNARCPRCGAYERHRALWLHLQNETTFFKDELSVLDIAPVRFFQRYCERNPAIRYVSMDIDCPFAMVQADITRLPFADEQFDCIICCSVLQYVPDDHAAMKELARTVSPSGWAWIHCPIRKDNPRTDEDPTTLSAEQQAARFGQEGHVRTYGDDFQDRLTASGLQPTLSVYPAQADAGTIEKHCLKAGEVAYICRKATR